MGFKVKDHYFNKAKKENYLARSIYKLEEIDQKFSVLRKGDKVLDLGYHPGSWIQYTAKKVAPNGKVVGIDIKPVNEKLQSQFDNISLMEKDINDVVGVEDFGVDSKFDVLLSDMAPNTTGIKTVDQARSMQLVEMIFYHLPRFLRADGNMVAKIFDSQEAQNYLKLQRGLFKEFKFLKPKSTRKVSKEFFIIGMNYKGSE